MRFFESKKHKHERELYNARMRRYYHRHKNDKKMTSGRPITERKEPLKEPVIVPKEEPELLLL